MKTCYVIRRCRYPFHVSPPKHFRSIGARPGTVRTEPITGGQFTHDASLLMSQTTNMFIFSNRMSREARNYWIKGGILSEEKQFEDFTNENIV